MFKKILMVAGLVGGLTASNAFADGHATLKQVQEKFVVKKQANIIFGQ